MIGDFQQGRKDGFGTYTYSNGDVYQGYWLNDKRAGDGKYFFKASHLRNLRSARCSWRLRCLRREAARRLTGTTSSRPLRPACLCSPIAFPLLPAGYGVQLRRHLERGGLRHRGVGPQRRDDLQGDFPGGEATGAPPHGSTPLLRWTPAAKPPMMPQREFADVSSRTLRCPGRWSLPFPQRKRSALQLEGCRGRGGEGVAVRQRANHNAARLRPGGGGEGCRSRAPEGAKSAGCPSLLVAGKVSVGTCWPASDFTFCGLPSCDHTSAGGGRTH